ncbi:MAG: ABC transporter permease [Promethearchaeota archaeon]
MVIENKKSNKHVKKSILLKLEEHLSKRGYKIALDVIILTFFILIIAAPIINIISNVIDNVGEIRTRLFDDALLGNNQWLMILRSLWESFSVAFIAVFIDILIAFPIAVVLTRGNFRGRKILDFLVDLPMAVPTSALGFSVLLFWKVFSVTPGRLLIIFVHVAFTYPYIVRNLKIALEKVNPLLEKAASTLKASKWTVFKTITFPLIREGLIAGGILAFTRSLGETGATIICSGLVETAPIVVVSLRKQLQLPTASFLSLLLIVISLTLLLIVKLIARRKTETKKFWQIHFNWEKYISKPAFSYGLKILSFVAMVLLILVPSFFIFGQIGNDLSGELFSADNKWAYLWISLVNSFKIGFIVVLIDVAFAIPFALILVRRKWGRINGILDMILDVPLTIPSAALGFAVFLFWGPAGINLANPGVGMIIFTHLTFTFPFVVRPIAAQLRNVNKGHEEASATLGAAPITTFRRITFPAIKNGIIAGMIAAFTRSLGETGATLIVMGAARTVPVQIVDWVEQTAFSSAAFASVMVIIVSALLLALTRVFEPERRDFL